MGYVEIQIPAMGEGIIEATIIRWLVGEGDSVNPDTPLVEIATDKVDSEIPAPQAGTIKKILRKEGDIPHVGETIALLTVSADMNEEPAETIAENITEEVPLVTEYSLSGPTESQLSTDESEVPEITGNPYLSPFIRKLSEDLGIGAEELAHIRGTAKGGRISKKDFYNYIQHKRGEISSAEIPVKKTIPMSPSDKNDFIPSQVYSGPHEVEKMDRLRKLISDRMVQSKRQAPHVTSFYEADLTSLVQWREMKKDYFLAKTGHKLTYTPLFIEAIASVLKRFPRINASLDGDQIILKKDINVGMATALPDGNLIVPVIKKADTLSLEGLAASVNDLSGRAREGKLLPVEITDGTFTLTNLGMFDSLTGTPIINQPESAILAIGAILRKPGVVNGPFGESIGIRNICILSLSYDHRLIDGAIGGLFLREVATLLEKPDMQRFS